MVDRHMDGEPQLKDEDARAVQLEWLRRVEAEYRSAALTQHLTLWLMQLVAPFELVRLGLAVVEDELAHAELSQQVYVAAGGSSAPSLAPGTIGLAHPAPDKLLSAVVRCALENFCLGETVAVRLFLRLRAPCKQEQARIAFDRIVKDEVRHKDFGWTLLEWLLASPEADVVRQQVQRDLPAMFARLRKNYAYAALGSVSPAQPTRAFWGLMQAPDYAAALDETLHKDYVPLFAAFDVDALAAWKAA